MVGNKQFHVTEFSQILELVSYKSSSLTGLLSTHRNDKFHLWYKDLTHSDLTNRGKRNGKNESLQKNFLYYLSVEQMEKIEQGSDKKFESAKQSNIGVSVDFYEELGVPSPRTIANKKGYCISDDVDVFLVNDTLHHFTMDYTRKVLKKLDKFDTCSWRNADSVQLNESGPFTKIQLSEAVHGIGTADDTAFHALRLSMFLNDRIYFLIRKTAGNGRNQLYIFLEKNPIFFTITGEANEAWKRHLEVVQRQQDAAATASKTIPYDDEKTRAQQSVWKEQLAQEMMNYTTHEGEVFCPFTKIQAPFSSVPMLFIASHIKRYKDSTPKEAYDINNGLLLSANADALFDKHIITITEDKKLRYSFLISNDHVLLSALKLNQEIFTEVLNEQRMEYMKDHRRIFEEKEAKRKCGDYNISDEEEIISQVGPNLFNHVSYEIAAQSKVPYSDKNSAVSIKERPTPSPKKY